MLARKNTLRPKSLERMPGTTNQEGYATEDDQSRTLKTKCHEGHVTNEGHRMDCPREQRVLSS